VRGTAESPRLGGAAAAAAARVTGFGDAPAAVAATAAVAGAAPPEAVAGASAIQTGESGRLARYPRVRTAAAWMLGTAGVIAYNWWLLVALKPGLMTSPDELFSNLEVTGQPYAALMQHADLASGLLLLAAFAVAGRGASQARHREWLAMVGFAVSGTLGGLYPEVCPDGISASCRRLEWHFQLPAAQYIHMAGGVGEFAAITIALLYAARRTRRTRTRPALIYRGLAGAALVAYPLLGAAYLSDRLGGIMEAVFFTGFSVMVITQIAEGAGALRGRRVARAGPPG
jgi:Protein of unknown function (DUF998)